MISDGDLVRATLAGRSRAYEELVRRWAGRVTALCHAKTGRAHTAEDLAQETLLRGFRGLATLTVPEKFGSWLCGIAIRACLDWLKAKERSQIPFSNLSPDHSLEQSLESRPPADGQAVEREDENRQLMAEVERLPEECREVLMLYYYEDVTYRDLALTLGVSTATINARLTRARKLLRERLGDKIRR